MSQLDYTHLHLHTHFSILDGAIKIPSLFQYCGELGMTSVGLTDHGSLAGVIDFYREGKKVGINPILGIEAYITDDPDDAEERNRDNYHLILLAKNNTGYQNLLALQGHAAIHNFYYKPRISWLQLEKHHEGLIATTACLAGKFARILATTTESLRDAMDFISKLQYIFGKDLYIEVQHHPHSPDQIRFNQFALEIARYEGIKLTISADAHYLTKHDKPTHDLLMAIQTKQTIDEYCGSELNVYQDTYVKSPQEMLEAALAVGEESAFWNTIEIAKQCKIELKFGEMKFPNYDITQDTDYEEFRSARYSTM